MKKICFVVSSPMTVNSFLLNHFEILSKEFEIYLVANFDTNSSRTFPFVKKVYNINISRKINVIKDIITFYNLLIFFSKNNFNAVHTITPKAGLLGMLSAYFCRIKFRIHIFTGQVWHTKSGFAKFILINFDKLISKLATNIIVDGASQREFLLKKYIITNEKSIVLGYGSISGVDIDKFKANMNLRSLHRVRLNIKDEHVVFSFLGRLNRDKGILDLVESFMKLKMTYNFIKLIIIGVDEEDIVQQIKNQFTIDEIIFVNYIDKPQELLQVSDIFCMPSYREGFGTSVIEASSLSLPVIVSDTYGLNDTVIENVTGLKYNVGSVKDLYNQMEILLLNKDLRKQYGINGREFVSNKLSSKLISNEWLKFYKNLLQ